MVKIPFIEKTIPINRLLPLSVSFRYFPIFFLFLFIAKGLCPRFIIRSIFHTGTAEIARGFGPLLEMENGDWDNSVTSSRAQGGSIAEEEGRRIVRTRESSGMLFCALAQAKPPLCSSEQLCQLARVSQEHTWGLLTSPPHRRKGWGHWTCTWYSSHFFQSFLCNVL